MNRIYIHANQILCKICHLTWLVHALALALTTSRWSRKERWEPLSIMGSINEDDWTSEQEHIRSMPPTCFAPDVTYSHAECARTPHLSPLFGFLGRD